jgi:tRNA dimethylallyltransferase
LPAYDAPIYGAVQLGVDLPTAVLDERINRRVAVMVERGLVDEVRALILIGLRDGVTSSRALGYAQVLAALDGRITMDAAVAQTAQATRRFVRRQRSWFRRDPRIHWLEASAEPLNQALRWTTG